MSIETLSTRIVRALGREPRTADELASSLGSSRADVRQALWYLVFTDRKVTCGSDRRYRLGAPPETWPKMTKIHR